MKIFKNILFVILIIRCLGLTTYVVYDKLSDKKATEKSEKFETNKKMRQFQKKIRL